MTDLKLDSSLFEVTTLPVPGDERTRWQRFDPGMVLTVPLNVAGNRPTQVHVVRPVLMQITETYAHSCRDWVLRSYNFETAKPIPPGWKERLYLRIKAFLSRKSLPQLPQAILLESESND
jgi:hypothetical protein